MKDFFIEVFIPIVVVVGPFTYAGIYISEWLKDSIKRKDEQKHKLPEDYWRYAPPWAGYAAMVVNGNWYWFQCRPKLVKSNWIRARGSRAFPIREITALVGDNFKKSLTERPANDKIR